MRTPIAKLMKKALAKASARNNDEKVNASRRHILKASLGLSASFFIPAGIAKPIKKQPKIAIIGAGMAGLSAAFHLQQQGYQSDIYEGSSRVGGRIFSLQNYFTQGLTSEMGGEFINDEHEDMLFFANHYNLSMIDRDTDQDLILEGYYFNNQFYTEAQIIEALRPIVEKVEYDNVRMEEDYETVMPELDQLSLEEYLNQAEVTGVARELMDVMMITEFGSEPDQQTCLNLIFLAPFIDESLYLLGESDERFSIIGGNERIIQSIAKEHENHIETARMLQAIRSKGNQVELVFIDKTVSVDFAIIAIPFSTLRQVEIDISLPKSLTRFIKELEYGSNAKLLTAYQSHFWRNHGYVGTLYSDKDFQLLWDSSQLQETEIGSMTVYTGGKQGLLLGERSTQYQAQKFIQDFTELFPEARDAYLNKAIRWHWPTYPYVNGSYACFKPRQYSEFIEENVYFDGEEGLVGTKQLIFAGEHVSDDYQGYMNGGAHSGRAAAEALLKILK